MKIQPIFNSENKDIYLDDTKRVLSSPTVKIGDFYQGGYVFRIFENEQPDCVLLYGNRMYSDGEFGYNDTGIGLVYPPYNDPVPHPTEKTGVGFHGMVANTLDYTGSAIFENPYGYVGASCKGKVCSEELITLPYPPLSSNSCVRKCTDLVSNGYSDWFLPSFVDMNSLYYAHYIYGFGNYTEGLYWCSSNANHDYVTVIDFRPFEYSGVAGRVASANHNESHYYVAVRQF